MGPATALLSAVTPIGRGWAAFLHAGSVDSGPGPGRVAARGWTASSPGWRSCSRSDSAGAVQGGTCRPGGAFGQDADNQGCDPASPCGFEGAVAGSYGRGQAGRVADLAPPGNTYCYCLAVR